MIIVRWPLKGTIHAWAIKDDTLLFKKKHKSTTIWQQQIKDKIPVTVQHSMCRGGTIFPWATCYRVTSLTHSTPFPDVLAFHTRFYCTSGRTVWGSQDDRKPHTTGGPRRRKVTSKDLCNSSEKQRVCFQHLRNRLYWYSTSWAWKICWRNELCVQWEGRMGFHILTIGVLNSELG